MKRSVKITLISSGVLTLIAPAMGLLGTISGMMKSFTALGSSKVSDPAELGSGIGLSLISTFWGLVGGGISFVVFLGAMIYWLCTRSSEPNKTSEGLLDPAPCSSQDRGSSQ